MVDITRRNFHLSRKFHLKSSRKKLLTLIQAIWNLIQLKSAKIWNSISELTSLFFQSLNELNSDPKYAIKRKFELIATFLIKFPSFKLIFQRENVHASDVSKQDFTKENLSQNIRNRIFSFQYLQLFGYNFWECILKAKPRHVFLSQFFVAVSIYHKFNFRFLYRQIIIMQVE